MMQKRIISMFFAMTLVCAGLVIRFYDLSQNASLGFVSASQSVKTAEAGIKRGNIYDCNFNLFVNRKQKLYAAVIPEPENMDKVVKAAQKNVVENLTQDFFVTPLNEYIECRGVKSFYIPERYEPSRPAAHIIGMVTDGKGASGIEKAYDKLLSGQSETVTVSYSRTAKGDVLNGLSMSVSSPEVNGGVVLTLDKNIQDIVEAAGNKYIKKGAVIVMETDTAELKAIASFPSFSEQNMEKALADEKNSPMLNRALSAFNVGSVFKVSTSAAALSQGLDDFTYDCKGSIDVGGQVIHCHNHEGHGVLDMTGAMTESCNTYFIALSQKIDPEILKSTARDLSFGKSVKLCEGIYSDAGTLPDSESLINPAEAANFSFGQGMLTGTPLQVTLMMNCVLNQGKLLFPKLVKGTVEDGVYTESTDVQAPVMALEQSVAGKIKTMMTDAVENDEDSNAEPLTVTSGGKTATAQTGKFDKNGTEYVTAWFSGFFPAENPQYTITVMCEEGISGNVTAAPVFAKIADNINAYIGGKNAD